MTEGETGGHDRGGAGWIHRAWDFRGLQTQSRASGFGHGDGFPLTTGGHEAGRWWERPEGGSLVIADGYSWTSTLHLFKGRENFESKSCWV